MTFRDKFNTKPFNYDIFMMLSNISYGGELEMKKKSSKFEKMIKKIAYLVSEGTSWFNKIELNKSIELGTQINELMN